jgi:hypothetical protein
MLIISFPKKRRRGRENDTDDNDLLTVTEALLIIPFFDFLGKQYYKNTL